MDKIEEALDLCGFGRFNVRLLLATLIGSCASIVTNLTSPYILPFAECDLKMNNIQKGLLISAPLMGILCSILFTGFLADSFGRRKLLIYGYSACFVCCVLEGSSQTYWMLMTTKFFEGISSSFTINTVGVLVAELTYKEIRDRTYILSLTFVSASNIFICLLTWQILPQNWNVVVWKDHFELRVWNMYLYINSVWALLAAILYYNLPESPKFLLSSGRSSEALDVLRKIFNENTGRPKNTFPITSLCDVQKPETKPKLTVKKQLVVSLILAKNIMKKPYAYYLLLLSSLGCFLFMAMSSLRLWFPQLSTILEYYKRDHGDTAEFCVMIDSHIKASISRNVNNFHVNETDICVPKTSGSETYINSVILNSITFICVIATAALIDLVGHKILAFSILCLSVLCSIGLYWANTNILITIALALITGMLTAASSIFKNIVVTVFPTSLRSLAYSIFMLSNRSGSMIGNILLPVVLNIGCTLLITVISSCCIVVTLLSLLLPASSKKAKDTDDH